MSIGLIVTSRDNVRRLDGTYVKSDSSRVVTLNDSFKFLSTRVYGYINKEIIQYNESKLFFKVVNYSRGRI